MKQLLISLILLTSVVSGSERATVKRVIDGDTIETSRGDRVRLVGINAPEIQDLFGQESKQHLATLVEHRDIDLIPDVVSSDKDRYQRLLRYVVLDGIDINRQMVEDGFAFAYLKFHFERSNDYLEAEKRARSNSLGIWGGEKDKIIGREPQDGSPLRSRSTKAYLVGGLVLILVCFGIYFYFKK